MSNATNYLEDELIKHLFRTGSFTKPTILAMALFTAAPGEAGGGTEVTGGSYARVDRPPGDANWSATAGGDGETDNVADIDFPAPTADWGTITHMAIWDALTTGNMLIYDTLGTPKTVNSGDPAPKFLAAALIVSVA